MKSKILVIFFALIAVTLSAQMPRSEWHAKVGECALDPVLLKATISKLSSADKQAFVAEVNEEVKVGFFAFALCNAGQSFKHAFSADTAEGAFAAAFTVGKVEEVTGSFNHTAFIADNNHTA